MTHDTSPAGLPGDAPILIIGAGQAATFAAEALRSGGHVGEITLLGDEPIGPYHRPPLSKAWLAGQSGDAQLALRPPAMLEKKQIRLRTGSRVVAIDRAAATVTLADGETLPWAGLVLATGASARRLPIPGVDTPGVCVLRSKADADGLAAGLADCRAQGRPLVVIGGGFIGLEVAATARQLGVAVTVLEAAPRLLGRVLTPLMSDWYAALHRRHGVELVLDARIEAIEAEAGRVSAVRLADGRLLPAGRVLLGVGVAANDSLAREAGLACDRGIVVDACGRTADPRIVAAGDCTARRLDDGTLLRLESVQNATEQARCAAAALLGQARPFTATPWFWSDQYDHKLQMAGLSQGADAAVLRGDPDGGTPFSLWHFRAGQLVAVDTVDDARTHLLARKLLDAGQGPTPAQVADPACDLASVATPTGAG
ncbi:NAD(P)/FAD-dependent oxidoreductase [Leptothrix discophora]|uniref:FAD-dependent oxidoreductase n=1 Tax=Leptothrix discophora TaxID=89 RepID=A0ABT9G8A4_LEPDI|nr:FAD-dependent oxidoreductase [Leptothrix discophora]MDP4302724.1 FAD-dependent oxidoreductase [Leptothrix discophora]